MKKRRLMQAKQRDWGKQQAIVEEKDSLSKYILTSGRKNSKYSLNVLAEVN